MAGPLTDLRRALMFSLANIGTQQLGGFLDRRRQGGIEQRAAEGFAGISNQPPVQADSGLPGLPAIQQQGTFEQQPFDLSKVNNLKDIMQSDFFRQALFDLMSEPGKREQAFQQELLGTRGEIFSGLGKGRTLDLTNLEAGLRGTFQPTSQELQDISARGAKTKQVQTDLGKSNRDKILQQQKLELKREPPGKAKGGNGKVNMSKARKEAKIRALDDPIVLAEVAKNKDVDIRDITSTGFELAAKRTKVYQQVLAKHLKDVIAEQKGQEAESQTETFEFEFSDDLVQP